MHYVETVSLLFTEEPSEQSISNTNLNKKKTMFHASLHTSHCVCCIQKQSYDILPFLAKCFAFTTIPNNVNSKQCTGAIR